ncbi:MAG: argininosuccinate lyase, partial [Clostridia bacterium]
MAKLWEGKFEKKLDNLAEKYNSSIAVDCKIYVEDILGSIAHAKMLGKCGIINDDESKQLVAGLNLLLEKINSGEVDIDFSYEDIHSFVEFSLTEMLGDVAKKLHTARSRNDQVATDFKLYVLSMSKTIKAELLSLITIINEVASENIHTFMPAYTHLQPAQPTSFAHYVLAYGQMLSRDVMRLESFVTNNNKCPLGSCALCGTTYNIDRFFTATELGFENPCENSIDGVSDRDFVVEMHSDISMIAMHLSRFAEEMILFCS